MNQKYRDDFPILKQNKKMIYFDNASTALKPISVIENINDYYTKYTANAYRGDYINSEIVSLKIDDCRSLISTMLSCSDREIIFTMNCTDSINLISGMLNINKRNKVICSSLEHHSNYLPWAEKSNLIVIECNEDGIIDLQQLEEQLKKNKIKLVSITAVSNVTGNIQPIKQICSLAHKYNAFVLIDCCQYIPHKDLNVKDIDCDFIVFSGHKVFGPAGVGVIYGKKEILEKCKKIKFGGGMVDKIVDNSNIRYKEIPYCFEAGTPPIENIIGLSSSIKYILSIGYSKIGEINKYLNNYFCEKLSRSKNIELIFPIANEHIPIFTLKLKNKELNIHYIAKMLSDSHNIFVSAGYQCCQPLYSKYGEKGGLRVSLQFYNTKEEIDYFFDVIDNLKI